MAALDGRRAIVTGASSGIGAATAQALVEAGARVHTGSRRDGNLDVTDPASCQRFVDEALAALGGIDILVNNAGKALGRDPAWEADEADEREDDRDERPRSDAHDAPLSAAPDRQR